MPDFLTSLNTLSDLPFKVWVLVPSVKSNDENLDYYYDFSQSILEYTKTFEALNLHWQWQLVTVHDYKEIINTILEEKKSKQYFPIIFNICDGDEINGAPGISVVELLQEMGLIYSGADSFFYNITTSKISMKKAFDKAGIPTPEWEAIDSKEHDVQGIFERLGTPIILKPSVSGGSMGVGTKNVVYNEGELKSLINNLFTGYHGWNLVSDGLIAESFIRGEEYTCLIVGDYNKSDVAFIYDPVERVFHKSLPEDEKFLSFDRLWEIYEDETEMPNEENFYEYGQVDASQIDIVKQISWNAYAAVKGTGYTRVDIRRDNCTGKMYVLEVNAQCGISEDEDYTSIGAILKYSKKTFTELVKEIIINAITRNKNSISKEKKVSNLIHEFKSK